MTTTSLYADVMGDLRSWLRAHANLASISGRVFFRIPDDPTFPLIRIYRAGGGNQPGEVPIEDVYVGIDVWGGSYDEVTTLANGVKAALHLMLPDTLLGSTTVGLNADVTGEIDTPDPDTGRPRKTLTALLTVRAAAGG